MTSRKTQQKKRKRHASPIKSQIAIRLEKLRKRSTDLWDSSDDDDDDDEREKRTLRRKTSIVLTDSDEERPSSSSSKPRVRRKKSTQKPTCLICSILSQLSTYNCCSEHLMKLKNPSQRLPLPEQVMILPITDPIVQQYIDSQQVFPLNKKTPTQKSSNKSTTTTTLDLDEPEQSTENPSKSPAKSPSKTLPPLASTIVIESTRSNSATIPPDLTSPTTTSIIKASIENLTIIDDAQQNESVIEKINKQTNPWIPISDEIHDVLEKAIDQMDTLSETQLEFTPATVRRTDTEVMAARLPKIPLKQGRFRQGKPIIDRTSTATNAANEYRPLGATQSSPSNNNNQSPPTTTTENPDRNIFTQDEPNQLSTRTPQTNDTDLETHRSNELSRTTTPSRISFRMNPDGTRVSISRPALPPTNPQSPLITSLRRTSTDVTPIEPNSKQV